MKENRIYYEEMESAVGLLEWCARFVEWWGIECYEPQRFLHGKLRKANQGRLRRVPTAVVEAFRAVRDAVESESGGQMLSDPVYSHPGDAVWGDASSKVGWGVVVGYTIYWGKWSPETIEAIGRMKTRKDDEASSESEEEPEEGERLVEGRRGNKVSISPLEALVQAYVLRAVRSQCPEEVPNGNFYSRCDNLSSVQVVGAGRAKSPAMTEALRIIREESRAGSDGKRWRMRLKHIGTQVNKVADLLSRGDIEEARAMVAARWGRCVDGNLEQDFLRGSESRVLNAIRLME